MSARPELRHAPLSAYGAASVEPSPVNRMMADFAADFRDGVDINLGVGFVNEATLPRQPIRQALDAVLADPVRYRGALNYGGPAGSTNLVDAVRRHLSPAGDDQALAGRRVVVGPNGATSLLESLALVLEPGIVAVADPMYYIYTDYLRRLGHELLPVPEDDEGLSARALDEALGRLGSRLDRLRFIYTVTVHNPTATVMTARRRHELLAVTRRWSAVLGRRLHLLLDRAYEDLTHAPGLTPTPSLAAADEDGLVLEVGTLSKILAPALRIGYLVTPPGALADAVVQRTSDAGFSAPLINQEIAAWLLDEHAEAQLRTVNEGYRHKARVVGQAIAEHLGDRVETVSGGRAGFYYYLTLRDVETQPASPFFRCLTRTTGDAAVDGPPGALRPRVVYIPGVFCVHPEGSLAEAGRRQLRLSYGYEELEAIAAALEHMAAACAYADTVVADTVGLDAAATSTGA